MRSFQWKIAANGYVWVQDFDREVGSGTVLHHGGKLLVPRDWQFGDECEWRWYEPLSDCPGLFRDFVGTPRTHEGIIAFANRYGHLGEGGWELAAMRDPQMNAGQKQALEDELNIWEWFTVPQQDKEWIDRINQVRKAVGLWDKFRATPTDARISRALQAAVDCQIIDVRLSARFEIGGSPSPRAQLHLVPNTLLGAIWLQLAQAIQGNKELRQCGGCGNWFEIGPETARKSKHYCSEACRSRAYRKRKDEARRLSRAGKQVAEIAELIGADAQSVKEWISNMDQN